MLKPENIGENLSIDETSLHEDLFTFLSNKAGHCRQGTIVAAVRGTRAEDVIGILMQMTSSALVPRTAATIVPCRQ